MLLLWATLSPHTHVSTATHGALFFTKCKGTEVNLRLCATDTQINTFDTEMEKGNLGFFLTQGYEVISNLRTQQAAKCVLRVQ